MRCAGTNNVDLTAAARLGMPVLRVRATARRPWPSTPWPWPRRPTGASARLTSRCATTTFRWTGCWGIPVRLGGGHRGHRAHRRGHGPHLPRLRHDGAGLRPVPEPRPGGHCAVCKPGGAAARVRPDQPALPADRPDPPPDQRRDHRHDPGLGHPGQHQPGRPDRHRRPDRRAAPGQVCRRGPGRLRGRGRPGVRGFLQRGAAKPGGAHFDQLPQRGGHQPPGFLYPHGAAKHRHHHDGNARAFARGEALVNQVRAGG